MIYLCFIMAKKKKIYYTNKFIKMALLTLKENDHNLRATSEIIGVNRSTIMRWRDKYGADLDKLISEEILDTRMVSESIGVEEHDSVISEYVELKSNEMTKALEIRDAGLTKIAMYLEKLTEENILKEDLKKMGDVTKILHELGTGEDLDKSSENKYNFWTQINNQILNNNHEKDD